MLLLLLAAAPADAGEHLLLASGSTSWSTADHGIYRVYDSTSLYSALADCTSAGATEYAASAEVDYVEDQPAGTAEYVWPHSLWVSTENAYDIDASNDQDHLFVAAIYSNNLDACDAEQALLPESGPVVGLDPCGSGLSITYADPDVGSIEMYLDPTTLSTSSVPDRTIAGPLTQLDMPHAVTVDQAGELIYVANAGSNPGVLIWDNAFTVNGNVAPLASLRESATPASSPNAIHYDETTDTLFVAMFDSAADARILIYQMASSRFGSAGTYVVAPNIVLAGGYLLGEVMAHDVRYDATTEQIYWTLRGQTFARFDDGLDSLVATNWATASTIPPYCTWVGGGSVLRCTPDFRTTEQITLSLPGYFASADAYGAFIDEANDALWLSLASPTGAGDRELALRYDNASALVAGDVHDEAVCWDSTVGYYETQSIWVLED